MKFFLSTLFFVSIFYSCGKDASVVDIPDTSPKYFALEDCVCIVSGSQTGHCGKTLSKRDNSYLVGTPKEMWQEYNNLQRSEPINGTCKR